jgi:hypothetical protein
MTALLLEEKQARQKFQQARERFELWKNRLALAEEAGRDDLVEDALREMDSAKQEATGARATFERIKNEKSMLRVGSRLREQEDTVGQAEGLVEQFRAMGVNPEDEELRQVAKDQAANDMLAQLKARMTDKG